MKIKIILFIFGIGVGLCGNALAAEPFQISLKDVSEKVRSNNYRVLENALRVYQAKESIAVARGNLLPRLNFWKIVMIPFDPLSAIGLIEDIAPFLVPANWFYLEEQKLFYLATQESYRALWANELMTAKSLYFHVLQDQSLLQHILENKKVFETLLVIAKSRITLGGVGQEEARDLEVKILSLEQDQRELHVLILEELYQLSYLMGYPSQVDITLESLNLPAMENFEFLKYSDFEFRTVDISPEIREFNHLIEVSDWVKKEATFSFLGSSNMSRGVAGGIFDGLPIQPGLGFGTFSSQEIIKAQKDILRIQKKGVEETLKRQLKNVINIYNLDLENYKSLKTQVVLTKTTLDQLYERLKLGKDVGVADLIQASQDTIQADSNFFTLQYQFLNNEDKLSRLIFHGDYDKEPAAIEKIKKRNG